MMSVHKLMSGSEIYRWLIDGQGAQAPMIYPGRTKDDSTMIPERLPIPET
jgi:hypothetical protein